MNAERRVAQIRARLAEEEVPVIVVTDPVNVAYLTGFEGVFDDEDAHAVVVGDETARLYTDGRYAEAAREASKATGWEVRVPARNLYATLCTELADDGIVSLAIEESVPHGRFRFVSREFAGNVVAVDQWIEEIRQVKEPEEIERVAEAQELTDRAFEHVLGMLRPGINEREIALEIEMFMRRNGSEGVAFPPIVASGANSSRPHAKVTDRAIERGDFVKLDFGAKVGGYCADMTRTVVMGKASERQREIYEAVLSANLAGTDAVAPGRPGNEIDAAARASLEAAGLAGLFTHGLGHGVGLEVHELPHVGPRGNKSVRAGSVITIEPGVYEPGLGGVRIEDLVVVEENGPRVLTRSPKDLLEL